MIWEQPEHARALAAIMPVKWTDRVFGGVHASCELVRAGDVWRVFAVEGGWAASRGITAHEAGCLLDEAARAVLNVRYGYVLAGDDSADLPKRLRYVMGKIGEDAK